ncbi:hypothetical protein HW555_005534 [Spodoptera exigua]|uniref:NADH dehydrogenase [ubiquinone] 1 alpha subcomplex subunit 7 n=1 Tax=Spodoptera exigua TaxID=7107 RepID=A0A835GHQ6_SPOEX|nr:hypothetical protein HW555_005534 [Spodoptera exigua]
MSKAKVALRDISPVMQKLRDFLLGRKHTNALRFEPLVAARTQPPPQIPDGSSHKNNLLFAKKVLLQLFKLYFSGTLQNYYYTRDGRREVAPPMDLTKQLLSASSDKGAPKQAANVRPHLAPCTSGTNTMNK